MARKKQTRKDRMDESRGMKRAMRKKESRGMEEYRYVQRNNIFYEDYQAPSNMPQESFIKMARKVDYISDRDYQYPDSPDAQVEQMDEGIRGMRRQKNHNGL